jgi:hypothetical protein
LSISSLNPVDPSSLTPISLSSQASSNSATSAYNMFEQMMQRGAQALSFSAATPSLSFSA